MIDAYLSALQRPTLHPLDINSPKKSESTNRTKDGLDQHLDYELAIQPISYNMLIYLKSVANISLISTQSPLARHTANPA